MKILVLGATGMLGHKMFQLLRQRFPDTHGTVRGSVNDRQLAGIELFRQGNIIENFRAENLVFLSEILRDLRPQVIVNCIGIIKQRDTAQGPVPCITLNALLPHQLAEICREWRCRLIHFSTDCVFSGKSGGYTEEDLSDATDLYGKTKYLGEVTAADALTLRTSIIGREIAHYSSLLEWFLDQNQKKVRGYKNASYSGVTTNYLVKLVGDVIENHSTLSGLYQVTSRQTISKYELLCLLREAYDRDVDILPDESFFCDRSMWGGKFHRATGHICPSWRELVTELSGDPTPYEKWRYSQCSYSKASAS